MLCVQVYLCHDHDTGRELAVKVVDIDHIDHAAPSTDSLHMQRVSSYSIVNMYEIAVHSMLL